MPFWFFRNQKTLRIGSTDRRVQLISLYICRIFYRLGSLSYSMMKP